MRRGPIPYSADEMAWLKENRTMIISDYHRAFQSAFERRDVSAQHLHALRKRMGWKVGRAAGRFAGRRLRYSNAEIEWLRDNASMEINDYHRAFCAAFGREDVTPQKLHSLRKREGFKTGRTGQFETGRASPNKGRPCAPGTGGRHPNAQRTQFRKGQLPNNFKGSGHERLDSQDGYIIMIVDETNPWTGSSTRPVHKHRYLWEKANGPVPEGHVLKCLDGDKTNCDPSNWEPIPRGMLPLLNGRCSLRYDHAEPEVKPVIMTLAKLKHRSRSVRKSAGAA